MYFNEAEHRMKPLVYVDNPHTLVWENSCGSGSSAVASALAHRKKDTVQDILLRQPGGDLRLSAVWDKESGTDPGRCDPVYRIWRAVCIITGFPLQPMLTRIVRKSSALR